MSCPDLLREQVSRLQALVLDDLAKENKALVARVGELEGRVNELEEKGSDSGFDLVRAEVAPTPVPSQAAPSVVAVGIPADRLAIARQIGRWLRECLGEGPKGKSGFPYQVVST